MMPTAIYIDIKTLRSNVFGLLSLFNKLLPFWLISKSRQC